MNNERNQSIKNIKLYETKPIFEMPKISIRLAKTMTNNKEQRTAGFEKQTQTNPIQSQIEPNQSQFRPKAKPIQTQLVLSVVEGSNPTCPERSRRVCGELARPARLGRAEGEAGSKAEGNVLC
jgi:hypothetical protein